MKFKGTEIHKIEKHCSTINSFAFCEILRESIQMRLLDWNDAHFPNWVKVLDSKYYPENLGKNWHFAKKKVGDVSLKWKKNSEYMQENRLPLSQLFRKYCSLTGKLPCAINRLLLFCPRNLPVIWEISEKVMVVFVNEAWCCAYDSKSKCSHSLDRRRFSQALNLRFTNLK